MRFMILRAALSAAFFATTLASFAGTLGVAGDFNGFVFGNLNANGADTEGRLAVGGNLTASGYSVGFATVGTSPPYVFPPNDHLVVGGDLDAIGGWQVFFGSTAYGGNLISSPTYAPSCVGCNTHFGTPVDFAAAEAELLAKSANWATLPTNGDIDLEFGTLTLTATNAGLNVFNVSESDWAGSHTKMIENDFPTATLLINIAGANVTQFGGLFYEGTQTPSSAHGKVLYNYPDATVLTNNGIAMLGSLLAPKAALALNGGGINGVGIAASVTQAGGEFHNFPFTGDIPYVPEPTTAGLALLGAAIAVCMSGRRGN